MSNGILDSFFTTLQNNPSVAAGSCTFVVAFALVAGNANYAQSGSHPDPIWATRDHTITDSVAPDVRPVKTSLYKPRAIPTPLPGDAARSALGASTGSSDLVASIQEALARGGKFAGDIDGMMGPLTRSSIKDYQAQLGLKETGDPSPELLLLIERDLARLAGSQEDALSTIISGNTGNNIAYDRDLVKQIQAGIAKAGIAAIDADGIYGRQTEAAIMDFQRRNKLEVTGKPDTKVLKTLIELKHLEPGQSNT